MGRPKLSDENRRSVNFTVRLSPAELKRLEALALVCSKSPGVLIREKVFSGKFPEPKMAKLDRDSYIELKKIGVNINQLAHKANSNVIPYDLISILYKLDRHLKTIAAYLVYDSQPKDR